MRIRRRWLPTDAVVLHEAIQGPVGDHEPWRRVLYALPDGSLYLIERTGKPQPVDAETALAWLESQQAHPEMIRELGSRLRQQALE